MSNANQSGRIVYLVSVSQGNVYRAQAGDPAWTATGNTTGDSPPLIRTGLIQSASLNQLMFFADGTNWVFYDPRLNTVNRWSATAGSLPVDSQNNTPRLICNWRGRIVLSGVLLLGQQLYMSKVDDPTDFLYVTDSPSPSQAFTTTVGPQGSVGDEVTALIPFNKDILVIGTSKEIHVLEGDPQDGGKLGILTNAIGMAFGRAWCQSPEGTIFFFSNKCGIYAMVPGSVPQEISQAIHPLLVNVNTGTNGIRLIWDDRFGALHVFITGLAAPQVCTHFVWEAKLGSWFTEEFANDNHNPLCVCDFDGNTADDRSILMGDWDGYVRTFSQTAQTDDGTPIESRVLLGPVGTKLGDEVMFGDAVATLGETAGPVDYSIYADDTAEKALSSDPVKTGTWEAGLNLNTPITRAAHALFCGLGSDGTKGGWSFERLRITLGARGVVRGRGRS